MPALREVNGMKLYLMRHGLAANLGAGGVTRDSQRPLTPKGQRRVEEIAQALQRLELDFDVIVTSPLLRARQTAEIVADTLGLRQHLHVSAHLAVPPDSPKLVQQINGLRPRPGSVLLVGHEPHLSEFAGWLIAGEPGPAITFKKGGLARLDVRILEAGRCASLVWLLPPRLLRRLG